MTESKFLNLIRKKNVVYITVKNRGYIRTSQIKRILEKEAASFEMYTSEKKNPLTRALDLRKRIGKINFSGADVIILGFLPQLIWGKLPKEIIGVSSDGILSKRKCPVIISDFFLSVYDTVVLDRRLVEDGHLIARFTRWLDKRVIVGSDLVLVDTEANAKFFSELYFVTKRKFETLYLEADQEMYYPEVSEPKSVIEEIQNADAEKKPAGNADKMVLYFGTGLPLQGTDIVMEAFDLVTSDPRGNVKCVFIGKTKGIPKWVLIKSKNNPNIEIIHWLSQRKLAEIIRKADLCIAGHFNLYIDKASRTIPGKAYIYEAMKKSMILGDTEANHEIFNEDSRHFFVPRGNAEALSECIKRFL